MACVCSRSLIWTLSAAIAAGLMPGVLKRSTAQGQAAVSSFQLSPGVVVDLDRRQAYVMSPEGAIVAVDLAAGAEVWRSNEASKPLTLSGGLLVSQAEAAGPANALQIVALDTANQGRPVTRSAVPLPPNVQPMIAATAHRSFMAAASPHAGDTTVSWEFVERPLRGVAPGPLQVLPGEAAPGVGATPSASPAAGLAASTAAPVEPGAQPRVLRGAVQINLASGAIAPAVAPHLATAPVALPPGAPTPAPPAAAAEILPGVPQPQFLSADGQHVMSSTRVADEPEWDKYLWTVFERTTGQRLGEFRTHLRYGPFFVTDGRVVYQVPLHARRVGEELREEPSQIRAMDLNSGARLWSQPIRDTVDRRPRPP